MLLEKHSLKFAFVISIYWLIFGISAFASNPPRNNCYIPIIISRPSSDTNLHRSIGSLIDAFYSAETIHLEFIDGNIGSSIITITHQESGAFIEDMIDSSDRAIDINISEIISYGHYEIVITTESNITYSGYFILP